MKFIKKIWTDLKQHFINIIRIKKSPHSIAIGFAVGTFISVLPTPGFNILLGVLITLIFERINKFSLFGAILIWNPLTAVPIYTLSYKLGSLIFGTMPVVEYKLSLFQMAYTFSRRFLVGNLILAISISIFSYFLVRLMAELYQANDKKTKKIN